MNTQDLIALLQAGIDDPMWANHFEINKATARRIIAALTRPDSAAPAGVEDDEDAYVIDKLAHLLAEIAVTVKGVEPPMRRHGYHDLPALVAAMKHAPAQLHWLRDQIAARKGQHEKLAGTNQTYTMLSKEEVLDYIDEAIRRAAAPQPPSAPKAEPTIRTDPTQPWTVEHLKNYPKEAVRVLNERLKADERGSAE